MNICTNCGLDNGYITYCTKCTNKFNKVPELIGPKHFASKVNKIFLNCHCGRKILHGRIMYRLFNWNDNYCELNGCSPKCMYNDKCIVCEEKH